MNNLIAELTGGSLGIFFPPDSIHTQDGFQLTTYFKGGHHCPFKSRTASAAAIESEALPQDAAIDAEFLYIGEGGFQLFCRAGEPLGFWKVDCFELHTF